MPFFKKAIILIFLTVSIIILFFAINLSTKYQPSIDGKKEPTEITDNSTRESLVKISEEEFIILFKEICPELLTERGTPISEAYRLMLAQFAGQEIDKNFVKELLGQLKTHSTVFDGKGFYGFHYEGVKDPTEPMNISELKKDTISVKFYLENLEFYCLNIFQKLTKQRKVKFARVIDEQNRFLFEAEEDMPLGEFLSICSDGKTDNPNSIIRKGEQYLVPASQLRHIPSIFEFEHTWKDHLGIARNITIALDISTYRSISSYISRLKDGTILKDDSGKLLRIHKDTLTVQRVNGIYKPTAYGGQYIENGKIIYESKNRRVIYNKFGDPEKTLNAKIYERNDQTILYMKIDQGSISFINSDNKTYRKIECGKVMDGKGNIILDKNDIAHKWLRLEKIVIKRPNLDTYTDTSPMMTRIAKIICSWYNSDQNKKNGLLKFVQSFPYTPTMAEGQAKTPKDALLSKEMDCEDASIISVSLFASAGFYAGFIYFKNRYEEKPGHGAPTVVGKGAGIKYGNENFAFAEATNPQWKVGEKPRYENKDLIFLFFQPHGKNPVTFK